uniref:Uncharacterized protein n=1 Tax=Pseudo-nitzschia australis TaxID=44445 RepID=A0A7S4EKH3_9STRA|mmetsp:Transcript_3475/g.7141  ORF Transcript_3475/g.7141 Transcript_3475/m.7141 type:complete len:210 (+) Transcript_3475:21-650(+)
MRSVHSDRVQLFRKRLEDLSEDQIFDLNKRFSDDVYIMVCIPSDAIIARNIVMGQGKGKNVEPVDWFKGMVCFNYNEEESVQDATLKSWNELCEDVGRDTLQDACILLAQRRLGTRVKKNGEVTLVEQFLRDRIDAIDNHGSDKGEAIFKSEVAPAARALNDFRKGIFKLDETDRTNRDPPSLSFLRATAKHRNDYTESYNPLLYKCGE